MDSNQSRLPPRPCGLCGHDVYDHAAGAAQRSRHCQIEICDCGEYISPLPFGRRWKWTDSEIRRSLRRLAGLGHFRSEPAEQDLDRFAFGDAFVVDFRNPPKHKKRT